MDFQQDLRENKGTPTRGGPPARWLEPSTARVNLETANPDVLENPVPNRFSIVRALSIALLCSFAAQSQDLPGPVVRPRVDERVELLSIVFRLAGNFEYNMNTLPAYSNDIDHYFAPYKQHPAVQMAHMLAEKHGVGFDSPMAMAISLSPPPELKPLVAFAPTVPDSRWAGEAARFLPLLRDFCRDSNFAEFFATHQSMYRLAEERFSATLAAVDFGWYHRFYGEAAAREYHLILGLNNGGGNYGPRLQRPGGKVELFSIMGCWTHDEAGNPTYPPDQDYLATVIHEFNHSFVNPVVAEHWVDLSRAAEAVYAHVAGRMKLIAYPSAQMMMDESLVRAAVIVYFQEQGEDGRNNVRRIRAEQKQGFVWMDQLVEQLNAYRADRTRYPTFASYVPRVASFYQELSSREPAVEAAFQAKWAHVVRIEPFQNKAQDVDPSITRITIVVDKALDPKAGYSINPGQNGGGHYPVTGQPSFDADGTHILVPVRLAPNQAYSFVLTPSAFSTIDGYPLTSYTVEFKTKAQ